MPALHQRLKMSNHFKKDVFITNQPLKGPGQNEHLRQVTKLSLGGHLQPTSALWTVQYTSMKTGDWMIQCTGSYFLTHTARYNMSCYQNPGALGWKCSCQKRQGEITYVATWTRASLKCRRGHGKKRRNNVKTLSSLMFLKKLKYCPFQEVGPP